MQRLATQEEEDRRMAQEVAANQALLDVERHKVVAQREETAIRQTVGKMQADLERSLREADERKKRLDAEEARLAKMQADLASSSKSKEADVAIARLKREAEQAKAQQARDAAENDARAKVLAKQQADLDRKTFLVDQAGQAANSMGIPPWWITRSNRERQLVNCYDDVGVRGALQACLQCQDPSWLSSGADQMDMHMRGKYSKLQVRSPPFVCISIWYLSIYCRWQTPGAARTRPCTQCTSLPS
jgi:hypothetical protein